MHWKWRVRLAGLAGFLGLQFWPYQAVSNPPEKGPAPMPPEISRWVKESCYDCHSHQVRLPWYGRVAPLSWWIADEVRRTRAGLNFSNWSEYTPRQRALGWRRSLQRIREQRMPPLSYRLIHSNTITEEQIKELETYLKENELMAMDRLSEQELLAWPSRPLVETGLPLRGVFRASGRLQRPLQLDNALILVEGDLRVPLGVSGRGAILATGRLTIDGISGEIGPLALLGLRGVSLQGAPGSQITGLIHSPAGVSSQGVKLVKQSSFRSSVPGVRQVRLEFCRDDGQLGERLERQALVRYGNGQYFLWDPEFQIVRSASNLDQALVEAEVILAGDPATSVLSWRRHFSIGWRVQLEQLGRIGQPAILKLQAPKVGKEPQ